MSAYRLSPRITSWMQSYSTADIHIYIYISYSTADIHIYIYHIAQLMASAFRGGGFRKPSDGFDGFRGWILV